MQVFTAPASEGFYKPMDYEGKKSAVAMLNALNTSATLRCAFAQKPQAVVFCPLFVAQNM